MLDQWLACAARSRLAPFVQTGTDGPQARGRPAWAMVALSPNNSASLKSAGA